MGQARLYPAAEDVLYCFLLFIHYFVQEVAVCR